MAGEGEGGCEGGKGDVKEGRGEGSGGRRREEGRILGEGKRVMEGYQSCSAPPVRGYAFSPSLPLPVLLLPLYSPLSHPSHFFRSLLLPPFSVPLSSTFLPLFSLFLPLVFFSLLLTLLSLPSFSVISPSPHPNTFPSFLSLFPSSLLLHLPSLLSLAHLLYPPPPFSKARHAPPSQRHRGVPHKS